MTFTSGSNLLWLAVVLLEVGVFPTIEDSLAIEVMLVEVLLGNKQVPKHGPAALSYKSLREGVFVVLYM